MTTRTRQMVTTVVDGLSVTRVLEVDATTHEQRELSITTGAYQELNLHCENRGTEHVFPARPSRRR